jgi:copper(I)-binding protein
MFYQKTVKYFLIFSFFGLLFFSSNLNAEISVENEWARVTPSGTGSVYMEIKNNGNSDDKLLSASSDKAGMVMIHRSIREGDISKMIHIHDGITIPGNSSVSLKPGDYHLMLMNLDKNLSLGDKISIILNFEKNDSLEINPVAKLRPPKMHAHK